MLTLDIKNDIIPTLNAKIEVYIIRAIGERLDLIITC
jgi:hypothetical protein